MIIKAIIEAINDFYALATASKVYGPYRREHDNRQIVIIKHDDGRMQTVSYPKYLVEKELGHELPPNMTVDHWDSNIDNNSLDNLKVIDRKEHSSNDTRRVKLIDLKCDLCHKTFQRSPRHIRDRASKGSTGNFCSRSCSGKYNRLCALKKMEKLPPQQPVNSEYYKRKYL